MTKICFVIHSLQPGGMERVCSELMNNFVLRENVEVHVILYGIKRDIFYKISDQIIVHKPNFLFDPEKRLLSTIKTVGFLRKKIKNLHPDTVLSFGELWNNLVLLATRGLKVPVFVTDRSQPDKPLSKVQEKLRKILYPKAAGVIAQTQKAKQIFSNLYHHENMTVIGNPIESIIPEEGRRKEILMVARLIDSKHQDELIEIFASLPFDDWELTLVGDDHLKQKNRKNWENLATKLGVGDRVNFEGMRLDVAKYYSRASIFAFTSSSEGFPNVIGEAMSAGLPIVAYDCVAGPSDLISHADNGFLIPLHDKKQFKKNLELLIRNGVLRQQMGQRSRELIKEFSSEKICDEFFHFITKNK